MDPYTLILTALAVGSSSASKDTSGRAIRDAYELLRVLLKRQLMGKHAAILLEQFEQQPEAYMEPLRSELTGMGTGEDPSIAEAALQILELADPQGNASGKYSVTIGRGQGLVIGDNSTVAIEFGLDSIGADEPRTVEKPPGI